MPKLRPSDSHFMDLYLKKAIAASAAFYHVTPDIMAQAAGIARATWYRRLLNPETFTVRELRRLIRAYRWDAGTVCDSLGIRRDSACRG